MASMGETGSLLVSANNRHIARYSLMSVQFPSPQEGECIYDRNVIFSQGDTAFNDKNVENYASRPEFQAGAMK
jgi:hypothetical protein